MNAKIKTISLLLMVAMALGSAPLLVNANGNNEWPLGVEIAATFDEILSDHQTAIQDFIGSVKRATADTQEERLVLIGDKQDELRDEIDELNVLRETLIAELKAGDIPEEDFGVEMRGLATDLANVAKSMETLGDELKEIGESLSGELKALAEDLVAANQQSAEDMAAAAETIASEMKDRDLPVPENLPNVPEEIPPV